MQHPPDLYERVARIEETMATRDDVAELRAEIARRRRPPWRNLGGTVLLATLVIGFAALVLAFASRAATLL